MSNSDVLEQIRKYVTFGWKVYCFFKILDVLNHSGAKYFIFIFVDFSILESDAGFVICEFKLYSGVLAVKITMNLISFNAVPLSKKCCL